MHYNIGWLFVFIISGVLVGAIARSVVARFKQPRRPVFISFIVIWICAFSFYIFTIEMKMRAVDAQFSDKVLRHEAGLVVVK